MIVLRRKTPRFDGTRYYAKPDPVQSRVEYARKFDTMADAETERATLREPWLWQAMSAEDASTLDAERLKRRMTIETKADGQRRQLLSIADGNRRHGHDIARGATMSLAHRALTMLHPVTFCSTVAGLVLGITSDLQGCLMMGGVSGLIAVTLFGALPLAWIAWHKQ